MPTVSLGDVDVPFPHAPYETQRALMAAVHDALGRGTHALLESPTGTGKTLSLLCAVLAWRAAHPSPEGKAPLVVYASRTHAQLSQVVRELRKTVFRPRVRVAAARERLCVHAGVRRAASGRGAGAAAAMCASLVRRGACEYARRTPDALGALEARLAAGDAGALLDIEDAGRHAGAHGACGYYVARGVGRPDVLLVPYAYLFDRRARQSALADLDDESSISEGVSAGSPDAGHREERIKFFNARKKASSPDAALRDAIVVVDEAHNIEGVCAEAASAELPLSVLDRALSELDRVEAIGPQPSGSDDGPKVEIGVVRGIVAGIRDGVAGWADERPGDGVRVFRMLAAAGMTSELAPGVLAALSSHARAHAEDALRSGSSAAPGADAGGLAALEAALGAVWRPSRDGKRVDGPSDSRHFYAFAEGAGPQKRLVYWCASPALAMRDLAAAGVRSVLLASGTLSPLASFGAELGLSFGVVHAGAHVVPEENVLCRVLPAATIDGRRVSLRGSFAARALPEYQDAVGSAVLTAARAVPEGVLVFFPSSGVLKACTARWRSSGLWDALALAKALVLEGPAGEPDAFAAHAANVRASARGSLLLAVCRGRASEGADFADGLARAVVVVGVPYPPLGDARVVLKRSHLAAQPASGGGGLSGDAWYELQAVRAVNQAVGRVIRHGRDYGAVLLLDERYAGARGVAGQLPRWLLPRMAVSDTLPSLEADLRNFFQRHAPAGEKGGGALAQNIPHAPVVDTNAALHAVAEARAFFAGKRPASPGGERASAVRPAHDTRAETARVFAPPGGLVGDAAVRSGGASVAVATGDLSNTAYFTSTERTGKGGLAAGYSVARGAGASSGNTGAKVGDSVASSQAHSQKPATGDQEARAYLAEVRQTLQPEEYATFAGALRAHRARAIGVPELVARVRVPLACHPALLRRFRVFLPPGFDDSLLTVNEQSGDSSNEIGAVAQSRAPSGGGKTGLPLRVGDSLRPADEQPGVVSEKTDAALPVQSQNTGDKIDSRRASLPSSIAAEEPQSPGASPATGPTCAVCSRAQGAHAALAARCGHACCLPCWSAALQAAPACPVCGVRTRLPHLRRL